jgi:uncharacterized FlaG/YvyC family protein
MIETTGDYQTAPLGKSYDHVSPPAHPLGAAAPPPEKATSTARQETSDQITFSTAPPGANTDKAAAITLELNANEVGFRFDWDAKKTILQVKDAVTGEVQWSFPSEEMLRATKSAAFFREQLSKNFAGGFFLP